MGTLSGVMQLITAKACRSFLISPLLQMEISLVRRSDFKRWRRCRLKHYFWQQQFLRPKHTSIPLLVGTAVHEALAVYYEKPELDRNVNLLKEVFKAQLPTFPEGTKIKPKDDPNNINMVFDEFHLWAQKEDKVVRWLQPETPISVHIFDSIGRFIGIWVGRLDGIIQRVDDGSYWVADHKTMSQFKVAHFDFEDQFTGYVWAARIATGLPIKGAMINCFRKKRGDPPNLLRYWTVRNPIELQTYHKGLIDMMFEMQNKNLAIYPNLTHNCSWDCPYVHDLCPAWRKGIPLQPFIQQNYVIVVEGETLEDYLFEEEEE